MTHGLAILLSIVRFATLDPLAAARDAFARGEYPKAEALALAAAQPPHEGAALYLAGLARFRTDRPALALEALDAAARTADPPARGSWQYNRGACLYDLGRFGEAEAAYAEAAGLDESLAAVALVNAGFAALDAGSRERAAALARRARVAGAGPVLDLVADLESRLGPAPLESTSGPRGWDGWVRLGGGVDGNVLQSGERTQRELAPRPGQSVESVESVAVTTGAGAAYRLRLHERLSAELAYGFDELAYLASAAADDSVQQHALAGALELSIGERARLGALASGQLAFTGLGSFRGLQRIGAVGAWVALDESEGATIRADVEWSWKVGFGSEFGYLTGYRADLSISQELHLGALALTGSYRYRDESIGTLRQATLLLLPDSICGAGCSQQYEIPLGYSSHTAALAARAPLWKRFELGAAGGAEWRTYHADSYLALSGGTVAELDRRRREDTRLFAGLWGRVRLFRRLDLVLRYDLVVNDSSVARPSGRAGRCDVTDPACHALDYDDKNYVKHVLGLEGVWRW